MDMKDHRHYSIGEAAEATGLSVKAIRHYEEVGLIPRPHRHDGNARTGGDRRCTESELARLRFVRRARHLDLGPDEIRRLIETAEETCPSRHPEYRRILTGQLETVTRRITPWSDLQTRLTALLSKDGSRRAQRCSGDGCGCLDADPSPGRKGDGGEATDGNRRQRKGQDPGSP